MLSMQIFEHDTYQDLYNRIREVAPSRSGPYDDTEHGSLRYNDIRLSEIRFNSKVIQ